MSSDTSSNDAGAPKSDKKNEEGLRFASQDLSSPIREDREAAERILLSAKRDSIPYLTEALGAPPPPFGEKQIGRIALLLGAMRAREALVPLFDIVKNKELSEDHRAFVARALGEILDGRDAFDDRAREALEILAQAEDRYTRAFSAKAFGQLGDERSMARVKALCADDDEWVREQAERVIAKYDEDNRAVVDNDGTDFNAFADLVSDANDRGGDLAAWLTDLGDSRRAVRNTAVNALLKAGKRSIPFLIDVLNHPTTLPKIGAATALGRLQATEAVAFLVIAATSVSISKEEKELVPVCLRALANCLTGEEEGVAESLLPLAKNSDRFVRAGALICLGRLSDRRGLPLIVDALRDKDPFVVESASIALSEGAREADVELVLPLLGAFDAPRKKDPQVLAEAILIALARIHVEHPGLRARVRHRVRREVRAKTAAARKAAIALLEELFAENDPPPLPLVDDVLHALKDRHPEVRVVAASFLARYLPPGFTGASKHLKEAIFKKERTLALLSIEALRRLNTEDARSTLEALTAFDDAAVATRAAELLDGWTEQVAEWRYEKKSTLPTAAPAAKPAPSLPTRPSPSVIAQRPSRVRGVQSDDNEDGAKIAMVIETKETRSTPGEKAVVVEAKEALVVESKTTRSTSAVEAKDAVVVEAKDAVVVEAKDAVVVEAKDAVAVEAKDAVVVEAKDAVVVEAKDALAKEPADAVIDIEREP
ncbi:MAG: hypothetical protein GY822_06505 [Deltaproteobacteria bacterium]|nr:hypothetical protein [Deltaproteobacteria bacterium]